jgi:hypothetical protein
MPVGLPSTLEIRPVPLDSNRSQDLSRISRQETTTPAVSGRQGLIRGQQLDILREHHRGHTNRHQDSARHDKPYSLTQHHSGLLSAVQYSNVSIL